MPTWIENWCEHWHWFTEASPTATGTTVLTECGWVVSPVVPQSGTGPYTGDRTLYCTQNRGVYKDAGSNLAEGYLNFHFKMDSTVFTNTHILSFRDGATTQLQLSLNSSGQLLLVHGSGSTLATSSNSIIGQTWYYIQLKFIINNTTGSFVLRVNSSEWASFSGDTQQTANAYCNRLYLYQDNTGGGNLLYANLVAYSDSASWPLSERRYIVSLVDAAGSSTQFTPLSSTNVSNVDEQQSDADTSYNDSTTPGNIDLFGTDAALSSGQSIDFTISEAWAEKTDAGARDLRTVVRSGGSNYESSSFSLTSGYLRYRNFRTVDPATSSAWTASGVNAVEVGYKDQA